MFRIATVILLAITTACMAQTTTYTPSQATPTQTYQQFPSYQQPTTTAYTTPSHQQPIIQNPTYNQPINNTVGQQYTQQFNNGQVVQQPIQPQTQTYGSNGSNAFNQPYSTSTPLPNEHMVINGSGGSCNSGASSVYAAPQYQGSYSSGSYRSTQPVYNRTPSRTYYQPRNNFRRWFGR